MIHKKKLKILVITPVDHIPGVLDRLEEIGKVIYFPDPDEKSVVEEAVDVDAIFTNPNKSKVYLGRNVLANAPSLKVICTASTGTNHIDVKYTKTNSIDVLSLTEERSVIERISSTAELAFGLTLASLRNIIQCANNALDGEWNYSNYVGRQMNCLNIGVVGYGRLGSMYAGFCLAFGARVFVYDPYKRVENPRIEQVDSLGLLSEICDVVSLHVHVNDETLRLIDAAFFLRANANLTVVNTSRGEIIDENALVKFLQSNPNGRIATDVLTDEVKDRTASVLYNYATSDGKSQVILTQHIGGMTIDAQKIAYGHAVKLLSDYFG